MTVEGHGSEGGDKSPMKLKWNSTHQMNMNDRSFQDTLRVDGGADDEFENSIFGLSSTNPARL